METDIETRQKLEEKCTENCKEKLFIYENY